MRNNPMIVPMRNSCGSLPSALWYVVGLRIRTQGAPYPMRICDTGSALGKNKAFEKIEQYLKQLVQADELDKLPISWDELQRELTDKHWYELQTALADEIWDTLEDTKPFMVKRLDDGSIAITRRGVLIKKWSPEWIEEMCKERLC